MIPICLRADFIPEKLDPCGPPSLANLEICVAFVIASMEVFIVSMFPASPASHAVDMIDGIRFPRDGMTPWAPTDFAVDSR